VLALRSYRWWLVRRLGREESLQLFGSTVDFLDTASHVQRWSIREPPRDVRAVKLLVPIRECADAVHGRNDTDVPWTSSNDSKDDSTAAAGWGVSSAIFCLISVWIHEASLFIPVLLSQYDAHESKASHQSELKRCE
jgi:hypothetical protein